MSRSTTRKGPLVHRLLIGVFGVLLTLLLVWLLGFVLKDIGRLPGPDYSEVEGRYVDKTLTDRNTELAKELRSLETQIATLRQTQEILRKSTEGSRQTMNQLLDMQRLSLEKNVKPTQEEQDALAKSEEHFLRKQEEFQQANEEIAQLSRRQADIQEEVKTLQEQITAQQKPAREEHARLRHRHSLLVAALKLGFLLPVLFAAAWLLYRKRSSPYVPVLYALFVAAFWKTGVVIHEHFPSEVFKYIAVGAGLTIVLAVLVYLIRMIAAPKADWLLKQHKEAYHNGRCPICAFPIQQGPSRYLRWTWRGLRGALPQGASTEDLDKPYACPGCGQHLYAPCGQCGKVRHVLLPYCRHCGAETPATSAAAGSA